MVTEQLGPRGKDADLRASFGEEQSVQSRHPSQLILHGPVVYADRLYDELIRDGERTACRADSGCSCHQGGGNRPVTPRYPPEGWLLIKSQGSISETYAFGCHGGHQAATRGRLGHQSDLLKPA